MPGGKPDTPCEGNLGVPGHHGGRDNFEPSRLGHSSPWDKTSSYPLIEPRTCPVLPGIHMQVGLCLFRAQGQVQLPGAGDLALVSVSSLERARFLVRRREWATIKGGPGGHEGFSLGPAGCLSTPSISPPPLGTPRVLRVTRSFHSWPLQNQPWPSPHADSRQPRIRRQEGQ